jgi:hypothetical protein
MIGKPRLIKFLLGKLLTIFVIFVPFVVKKGT